MTRSASNLAAPTKKAPTQGALVPWAAPQLRRIRSQLLNWYDATKRDLPWRRTHDPYRIWLSEVMLQQTRVAAVIDYYQRFLKAFPTVQALARAPLEDVLRLWSGLGYYSRAKNLHAAARHIAHELDGEFPQTVEALLNLPGVGRYTAGAIASIAFGRRAAVLDGNVKRVLARIISLCDPITETRSVELLWRCAEALVPALRAGDFNQALMELGAVVCTPRSPRCAACPLRQVCAARRDDSVDAIPVRGRKKPPPRVDAVCVAIDRVDKYLFVQRPQRGLLGGFWHLPQIEVSSPRMSKDEIEKAFGDRCGLPIALTGELGVVIHQFTHRLLHLRVMTAKPIRERYRWGRGGPIESASAEWMTPDEYEQRPISTLDRNVLQLLRTRNRCAVRLRRVKSANR